MAKTDGAKGKAQMRTFSAKDAKNKFGELIDLARAAPVTVEKYGRSVVVVLSVEEYERLNGIADEVALLNGKDKGGRGDDH